MTDILTTEIRRDGEVVATVTTELCPRQAEQLASSWHSAGAGAGITFTTEIRRDGKVVATMTTECQDDESCAACLGRHTLELREALGRV